MLGPAVLLQELRLPDQYHQRAPGMAAHRARGSYGSATLLLMCLFRRGDCGDHCLPLLPHEDQRAVLAVTTPRFSRAPIHLHRRRRTMSTPPPSLYAESRLPLALLHKDLPRKNVTRRVILRLSHRGVLDPVLAAITTSPKTPRQPLALNPLWAVFQDLAAVSWHEKSKVCRAPCESRGWGKYLVVFSVGLLAAVGGARVKRTG